MTLILNSLANIHTLEIPVGVEEIATALCHSVETTEGAEASAAAMETTDLDCLPVMSLPVKAEIINWKTERLGLVAQNSITFNKLAGNEYFKHSVHITVKFYY